MAAKILCDVSEKEKIIVILKNEFENFIEMIEVYDEPDVCFVDEADGFNREFRLVESKSQIPERAVKLPSSVFNSWELYYDTVSVREQIPEKACFIEKEMLDVYKKWNGLYNIALYYVLVK